MELVQVTKIEKRNKATSKRIDDNVILANCDVIAIVSIYDQIGALQEQNYGRMVSRTYIFINNSFSSYKIKTELNNL